MFVLLLFRSKPGGEGDEKVESKSATEAVCRDLSELIGRMVTFTLKSGHEVTLLVKRIEFFFYSRVGGTEYGKTTKPFIAGVEMVETGTNAGQFMNWKEDPQKKDRETMISLKAIVCMALYNEESKHARRARRK